jgi:hypothetical protein
VGGGWAEAAVLNRNHHDLQGGTQPRDLTSAAFLDTPTIGTARALARLRSCPYCSRHANATSESRPKVFSAKDASLLTSAEWPSSTLFIGPIRTRSLRYHSRVSNEPLVLRRASRGRLMRALLVVQAPTSIVAVLGCSAWRTALGHGSTVRSVSKPIVLFSDASTMEMI